MPIDNPYQIFVTHPWDEDDDYLRLFEYLGDTKEFYYVNLSAATDKPAGQEQVRAEIERQINNAEVVIVLSGQYPEHSEDLDLQLATAKRHAKPILAVEPFGPNNMDDAVREKADKIVPWYNRSIVDAIKLLARGEDTARFEVLDFP